MNVSFSVAMMLQAVNNMGPGIQSAQRMINGLGENLKNVAKQSSNLNPVQGWEDKVNKVAEAAKRIGKELKESGKQITEQGEKMQKSGMRNTAEGAGMMAPILYITDKAGQLQMKQTSMEMAGISKTGINNMMQQADEYSKNLRFDKIELADMFLSMRKGGMKEDNILRGSDRMMQFAELEKGRNGMEGPESVKILTQMAERGGVMRDPNIDRFHDFLEITNQVATVTSAGLKELHESSKYLEPTAQIAGWNEKDMMWSQGIAARFGLEGSVAGTDLKDMISRLNPYKFFKEGRPSQQIDSMQRLGWLEDVESHKNKAGRTVYDGIGSSVMLNSDGTTKNMMEVFGQFAKSYEKYKDLPNGMALFAADMHKVLGEQGEKTALLVAKNYDVVTNMVADASKVKSIPEQTNIYAKQYPVSRDLMKNQLVNLEIEAGTLLLPSMIEAVQALRDFIAGVRMFVTDNPGLVSGMLKFTLGMGLLKIGIGLVQIIFGTLMTTFGGAMTVFGWISTGIGNLGIKLLGLRNGFQYFRSLGGGVFESLWKGAQFAWPWLQRIVSIGGRIGSAMGGGIGTAIMWLAKLGGGVSRFVMQWLIQAARIGAGWLIAMGPVGWVILGVTALIAAGVWAWNTNFMGFRDKCISIWNSISDWGKRTWGNITSFVQSAIDRISHFIDRVKEALGLSQKMSFYGPIKGAELDPGNIPFVGGSSNNTNRITQHNHISLKTPEEAANYTQSVIPDKYQLSLNP